MIGQFSTTNVMQDWFVNNLPIARKVLSQFNTLNTLFSSFDKYEKKEYEKTKNVILRFCLPDFQGKIDTKRLTEVEDALLIFNVFGWKKTDRNCLKDRLCRDDYYLSLTQYTEITYAKWLAERIGKDNVEIYPKLRTGRISDILIKLDAKSVYLEIGNLSESVPEKKIQKILDEAAKHIGSKQKDSVVILLEVNVAELLVLDSEKHIDEKASIEKLTSEIDRLCIDKLTEFEGRLDIDEIAETLRNKQVMENLLKRSPMLVPPNDKEKLKLINTPAILRWIDSSKGQIAKGSKLVSWISRHKGKFLLVEVHPQMFYPSVAALSERDSFINHVIRHIGTQLEQLQPSSPNIIVIQGFNWVMFGLGEDIEDIEPLSSKIRDFLNKNKYENLSGVAFFSDNFAKTVFIANAHASENSKLSQGEMQKLGMKTVP